WVRTNNTESSSDTILAKWDEVGDRNYWLGKLDASTLAFFVDDTQMVSTSFSLINDGGWHHLAGVADATGQNLYLFVDGILRNTASYTGSMQVGDSVLDIGNNPGSVGLDQEWDGLIDEARISKSARSSEWILTSYKNQISPSVFYSLGQESQIAWFNPDWSYRKEVTVAADTTDVPAGYSIHLTFDHATLVSEGKSLANGNDIRIVYWDGSQWNDLDRMLDTDSSWNSDSTKIWFKTQTSIPASSSDSSYYLYYGNPSPGSPPSDSSSVFLFYDGFESGDLSAWDGWSVGSAGDDISPITGPPQPNTGTYSARCENDNLATPQAMVWKDFTDETSLLARTHLYLDPSFSISSGGHVTVMQFIDNTPTWVNQLAITINDDMTIYVWNAIAGEAYGYGTTSTLSTGIWYTLEMQATISDTNGEVRVWLDGNLEIDESGRNIGTEGINRYCAGFYWASPQTEPNIIYVDDAFLRSYTSSEPTTFLGPELSRTIQFNYKKDIVIDHTRVNADLADFPLLIDIYDTDLKTDAQVDGDDILFLKDDWILPHEIELFDQTYNSTHAHLVAWVKTNLSSSMDTVVSMYYGNPSIQNLQNPTSVWSNSYGSVWHLNDDPTGTIYDSTPSDNDGTSSGGMTSGDQLAGQIDGSLDFDGSDDEVNLPGAVIGDRAAWTISAWIKMGADTADQRTIYSEGNTGVTEYLFLYVDDTGSEVRFYSTTATGDYAQVIGSTNVEDNQWHFVTFVQRTKTNRELYVDGSSEGTSIQDAGTFTTDTANIGVLISDWVADWFKGTIDEVRISYAARSADWITTEFNNQHAIASFLSVGSEIPLLGIGGEFLYQKEIVIDHTKVDADLTDFPLLINTYDTDLRIDVQADGDDIVFAKDDLLLPYEIELFDQSYNSTHAHIVAWVKTDLSSSVDTKITMYYGNPAATSQEDPHAVWQTRYQGVWHLGDNPSAAQPPPQINDSTDNNNDGTTYGTMVLADKVPGQIGESLDFDGSNDYVDCGNTPSLSVGANDFALSAWFATSDADVPLAMKGAIGTDAYRYMLSVTGSGTVKAEIDDNSGTPGKISIYSPSALNDGLWHHAVMVRAGNLLRFYIDGLEVPTSPVDITGYGSIDSPEPFLMAACDNYDNAGSPNLFASTLLDEVRILGITITSEWILAEYRNQNAPSSFYSIGNEALLRPQAFANKKTITVDSSKVLADLNDFPLLIDLYDEDLRTKVQADGDDISFQIGELTLDHEIEIFDQTYNLTHAHLVAWVRIPYLSSAVDTEITMLYGNPDIGNQENPGGVWSSRYAGVWHLSEDTGNALDSTSHGTQGTSSGGVTQGTTGAIGQAYDFDGIDGSVDFGDPADGHLDFGTSSFSYSIWLRVDSNTGTWQLPISKGGDTSAIAGYEIETASDASAINSWISDGTQARTTTYSPVTFGQWMFVVAVVNRETNRVLIFRDGVETGSGSSLTSFGSLSTAQSLYLSRPTYELDGAVDEARIALHPLDPNWIYTEYLNQKDPSSFYTVGAESGTEKNEVSVGFTTNSDSGVSLSATLKLNTTSTIQSL
ncbi:MAG: DUF2341 domain-containing protein, partial [Promethearchaeota archaeon]